MNYLRLTDVATECGKVLNLCKTDPRLVSYVNRACQRLLYELKSVGTMVRYRVCSNGSCLVWPRQLETIEAFALCKRPGTVRSQMFEFLGFGPGILTDTKYIGRQLVDQGEVCSFDNVKGTGKKLAVYCDTAETGSIILQYYDKNGQWIRVGGIDGETISYLAAGQYALSTAEVLPDGFVKAIKQRTNGIIRIYEFDTVALTYKPLSYYDPDELVPVYRKSIIPALSTFACCGKSNACDTIQIDVMGKLRFIPVANDNDFLPINHPEAVRLGCQAVAKEEKDLLEEANTYWYGMVDPVSKQRMGGAVGLLKKQIEHWIGAGAVQPIKVVGSSTFGAAIPSIQ